MDGSPAESKRRITIRTVLHSVVLWSILFAVVVLAGMEIAARLNVFNDVFPFRSLGMSETIFQLKWQRISEYRAVNGNIDGIILGSSLVNTGIDPADVVQQFTDETGATFTLFNFGVEGFTVETSELASQILIDAYHPSVVILGTEMRDYYSCSGTAAHEDFIPAAWTRYQLGEFSPYGFLISHSIALQVALSAANWMLPDYVEYHNTEVYRYETMSLNGYENDNLVNYSANTPIDFSDPQEQHLQDLFLGFSPDPERVASLQRMITSLADQGITVVIVDMPINPSALGYYGGEVEYQEYHTFLQQTVEEAGGIYIPALTTDSIPLDGWSNRHHLNIYGAPVFSRYLGHALAQLYQQGELRFAAEQ
jgi:hypothetical protein